MGGRVPTKVVAEGEGPAGGRVVAIFAFFAGTGLYATARMVVAGEDPLILSDYPPAMPFNLYMKVTFHQPSPRVPLPPSGLSGADDRIG